MRLFLLGVPLVAVFFMGCRKEDAPPSAGALRVSISYATFHPACLTLRVVDREDPSRTDSTEVPVEASARSDERTVAILGREGWSRNLTLTATAHERSCNGPLVAEQSVEAQVPVEGVTSARLALRAEDLDDDGYVSGQGALPGTDCDDDAPGVHPGATELCDGIDNNCANGEADAPDARNFYADGDGDDYGARDALPVPACVQPAGTATRTGDCDDGDADIHPGQRESLCDGVDEDCDGTRDDDDFAVGATCATELGCPGVRTCQGVSSAACVSEQQPVAWYVDEDGDGKAGAEAGSRCTEPVPGATTVRDDCDESSRFASTGATDGCDRLDNDCDGTVDEDAAGCGAVAWTEDTVGAADARWNAVAPYGENRGWLAGETGRVVHVSGATFTPVASCDGTWQAAWAASNGRVFLGSSAGELATVRPEALDTCERVSGPATSGINGMVGFEQGSTVRLFVVDSQGRVIRWEYVEGAPTQAAPQAVTRVAANLRAIHGLGPETLLAVGSEVVDSEERPVAWRAPASGSTWLKEDLGVPASTGYLRAVRVLTPRLAYVAGDGGLLLERAGTAWSVKPAPGGGTADLRALLAFGRTALYVVTSATNDVHFFDGTAWSSVTVAPHTLNALEGTGPAEVWGAGFSGTLVRWKP
ncbi:putative metal-binding motif-containing protein [Myxococcus sp. RHSTA-1-4]|uniref:putative metal-binding motif-containing protein n=1 Tax=Myxococcus sp. RHSTA-1-4 TaxID=2874601 RepID=UPI001CBB4B77|nr:putative metal-binding motif-containing protein [Myxococcus sp. RHSTA-1-4]MBZ4417253.1 putative metal-binding motif-containing protein [Myxococcus sp. RHSTA-1-4]